MGDSSRFVVRNAAKLAVYVDVVMRAKNHQVVVISRVAIDLGLKSTPLIELSCSFDF